MCKGCLKDELSKVNKSQPKKNPRAKERKAFDKEFDYGTKQQLAEALDKQLDGKNYVALNEHKSVYLIPGLNLDDGVLCGTNCYAIGRGQKRILIDACKYNAGKFLYNLESFVTEQECYFDSILITHAHYDHMDGAQNVVDLMESLGLDPPQVYKFIDGNLNEETRIENNPGLEDNLFHCEEGDHFVINDVGEDGKKYRIEVLPIETSGHTTDHLNFMMTEEIFDDDGNVTFKENTMFTGDQIIGTNSTFYGDYPDYYNSLLKIEKMVQENDIKYFFVAHSKGLYPKDCRLHALDKV